MKKRNIISNKGKNIEEVILLEPNIFEDERGFFYESWNLIELNKILFREVSFKQDNHSFSKKGVLRGIHYQLNPYPQAKLIRCVKGIIFDIAVDLRKNSKTFGQWVSAELTEYNHKQLWIPEGFGHGYLTISSEATVLYKATNLWNKDLERCINWDDQKININWPLEKIENIKPILSAKDSSAMTIEEASLKNQIFV